jgi:hypothetical protein
MWALMALGLPRCKCEFAVPLYVTCVSETACKQKRTKQKTKVLKTIDLQFHGISRFSMAFSRFFHGIGLPVFFNYFMIFVYKLSLKQVLLRL